MTASCPGFATYNNLSNGQVSVNGRTVVFTSQSRIEPLIEAWERFGASISKSARRYGIPASWLVGIMMAESKGNPLACSPCSLCSPSLCATGAGLRCCAFGLMQFIEETAIRYGTTPTQLIQSPALAIEKAAELVSDLGQRVGFDLVRIAAAYNGGLHKCGKAGTTFGFHTNGDYPMVVVQYANTFVHLGLPTPASASAIGFLFAAIGLGAAAAVYHGKI